MSLSTLEGGKATQENALFYKSTCGKCGATRVDNQIGLEKTPEEYIAKLVKVFEEVKRVLKKDGVLFLNLGDSYVSGRGRYSSNKQTISGHARGEPMDGQRPDQRNHEYLKDKDLCMIPARVAIALQQSGWWLRQDIIWSKPNPMPESVTDRCTKRHEYIFLLTKSARYYYDADAIRESFKTPYEQLIKDNRGKNKDVKESSMEWSHGGNKTFGETMNPLGSNRRSVWEIATQPFTDWIKTPRLRRVERDAVSCGMMHIVSPICPIHASLYPQIANHFCDGREGDIQNRILHTYNRLSQEQSCDFLATDQSISLNLQKRSSDYSVLLSEFSAILHNIENHKTDLSLLTNQTYMPFEKMIFHIDDKRALLLLFGLTYCINGNSILPDEMDVHLLDRIPYHKIDKSSLESLHSDNCSCIIYEKFDQETSHFAVFPEEIPTLCIKAGSKKGDTVLDPFCGSGTTGDVALRLERNFIGIELNEKYVKDLIIPRLENINPLFK